jgi:23S rRNA (uracil1939-C5)-methyltransferase
VAQGVPAAGAAVTVVQIGNVAAGGDGVGRLDDGMAVFVPRTAPGDEVEIEITRRSRRHARARALRIRTPGPGRVSPACVHYVRDACGGCQLQHLDAERQLAAKRSLVGAALRRIGHRDVADPPITPSPAGWRYRTKLTLAVSRDGERIGLHPLERPGDVFGLEECPITSDALMELWQAIRAHRTLLPPATRSITLRADRTGGIHVVVGCGAPRWDATRLATALGRGDVSYWWHPPDGAPRVVAGPRTGFPALAFEQGNAVLADAIRRNTVAAMAPAPGMTIWDLYGGVGDAARLMAQAGAAVWSVEADRGAVEWATQQSPGPNPSYVHGLVEETLHRLPTPHAVLMNPPRVGVHSRVTEALERLAGRGTPGPRLAYVSCDPATLARDVARLPSYAVRSTAAFDLFPQTSHVEAVVVLEAA